MGLKTLAHRLEKLEHRAAPVLEKPKQISVEYLAPDGTVVASYIITVPSLPFGRGRQRNR
jgi:hypothetical protein